jgi:hypothetical protein
MSNYDLSSNGMDIVECKTRHCSCGTDITFVKAHTHISSTYLEKTETFHFISSEIDITLKDSYKVCICIKCAIKALKEFGRYTDGVMEDGKGNPIYVKSS